MRPQQAPLYAVLPCFYCHILVLGCNTLIVPSVGSPGCSFYLLLCSFVLYFISSFVGRLFGWRSFWIWGHPVLCNVCWFRFRSGMQFVCSLNVRRLFSSCARQLSFSLRLLIYLPVVSVDCVILFLICVVHMVDDLSVFCMVHLVVLYSEAVICSCMVILFFSPSTSWSIWSFHLSGHVVSPF